MNEKFARSYLCPWDAHLYINCFNLLFSKFTFVNYVYEKNPTHTNRSLGDRSLILTLVAMRAPTCSAGRISDRIEYRHLYGQDGCDDSLAVIFGD